MAVAVVLTQVAISRTLAAAILGAVALLLLAADLVRLLHPPANALFFRTFPSLASPREAAGPASSTWYAMGMCLAVLLFPRAHAVSGILVLALADPAGSYIGRRWGRRPFLGGTRLGSAAFVAVALAVLGLRHPPAVAVTGAVVAMLAERRSWPLDDNLAVPVVTAAVTTWVAALL